MYVINTKKKCWHIERWIQQVCIVETTQRFRILASLILHQSQICPQLRILRTKMQGQPVILHSFSKVITGLCLTSRGKQRCQPRVLCLLAYPRGNTHQQK